MPIDLADYIARRNKAREHGYEWLMEKGPHVEPDWNDPKIRKACASAALTLISPHDDLIRRAFQEWDLNPLDWRALLWSLTFRHYVKARKRDPRERWDEFRLFDLLGHFYTVKRDRPTKNDSELCGSIKRRFADKYRGASKETIRRQLSRAIKEFILPIETRLRRNDRQTGVARSKKHVRDEALALFCSTLDCAESG
jgi:hypothetical protein